MLDGDDRLHDKSNDASECDRGEDCKTAEEAVLDGGGASEHADFTGQGGDVLEDRVSEYEVGEEGTPNAELTAHDDLVESVGAEEDTIVEVQEPEADAEERDDDEGEHIGAGSHLVQLGVLALAPF